MAKAETSTRAPRGSKPVMVAFFTALDATPEATRSAIARAAQTMIRDELKARREKVKALAAKEKARKPTVAKPAKAAVKPVKTAAKAVVAKAKAVIVPVAPKVKRPRKPAAIAA